QTFGAADVALLTALAADGLLESFRGGAEHVGPQMAVALPGPLDELAGQEGSKKLPDDGLRVVQGSHVAKCAEAMAEVSPKCVGEQEEQLAGRFLVALAGTAHEIVVGRVEVGFRLIGSALIRHEVTLWVLRCGSRLVTIVKRGEGVFLSPIGVEK